MRVVPPRLCLSLLVIALLPLLFSFFPFNFSKKKSEPKRERIEFLTMGTVAGVTFVGPVNKELVAQVQDEYSQINALVSAWNPTSELSRVAHIIGHTNLHLVSARVRPCYVAALRLMTESGGAFNPYIGKTMREWGFAHGGHFSDFDLGAIAKGFAVDCAYDRLAAVSNVPPANLLLDLGGNLRVMGKATWRTGVRNPFAKNGYAAYFTLTNGEAVATSGNYERFIMKDGKRVSHIFDGRNLRNVEGVASVTVIAPNAMLADALSTTLFVLGPEEGQQFLAKFYPDIAAVWIPDTPPHLTTICTPSMQKRIKN